MCATPKKIPLLRKNSRSFLLVCAALMVLSCIGLYYVTGAILQNEIEEELYSTENRVVHTLKNHGLLTSLPPVIELRRIDSLRPEYLKDTIIYDPSQDEMELFHELSTFQEINGIAYQITIRALVVETEDILLAVVTSYICVLFLAFLILYYFNKKRNQDLWSPFFNNLEVMKHFSLTSEHPINLRESEILEFTELNREVQTLTRKVRDDYQSLKQFTENISHEIQTPLAIIQAKIEHMMNGDGLNDQQFEHLSSVQKDLHRLTQLNKKLTLLTKIDNDQFQNVGLVSICDLVGETIENFRELSPIQIVFYRESEIIVEMDPHLASVLSSNLISNALKYSDKASEIQVYSRGMELAVCNPGSKALQNPEKLFGRYYKEARGQKSTGLGLAIVKRICDLYGFGISYSFVAQKHIFRIAFHP